MQRIIAGAAVSLVSIYTAACWYFSGELVHSKVKSAAQIVEESPVKSPKDAGLPAPEIVKISTGVTTSGWYFANPRARCALVLHHGHGARREGDLKYASVFYDRGCHLLMIDSRFHGESTGGAITYGYYEKHDLVTVVDWLRAKTKLPPERIGLFGDSMGAAISTQAAGLRPPIGFVILDSPFRDLVEEVTYRAVVLYGKPLVVLMPLTLRFAAWRGSFDPRAVSPAKAAAAISVPVLIIHAKADEVIPFAHGQSVHDAVPHKRKEVHITNWGATHCKSLNVRPREYRKIVYDFLDRFVPGV